MVADAEVARRTEEIPAWKQEEVDTLTTLVNEFETIGIVTFTGIPSKQLQNMRRELHGRAELRVSRNTLLIRALEAADRDLDQLVDFVEGQVGIIASNDNPFGLYRQLEASKTPAPINAGEIAPNDIIIPAGDTGIDPGPFVGELQQVGADARIDEGSIKVLSDSKVASTGDEVSAQLAGVLSELEMEPKEVGLDLRGVLADGILFQPEELAIDVDEYRADIQAGVATARGLSVTTGYPTSQTIPLLLRKALGSAKGVGIAAAITEPDLVPDLLSTADAQVRWLASHIDDEEALPEALRAAPLPSSQSAPAEQTTEDDESASDADETDDEDDEEEDENAGAAGLGDLFG